MAGENRTPAGMSFAYIQSGTEKRVNDPSIVKFEIFKTIQDKRLCRVECWFFHQPDRETAVRYRVFIHRTGSSFAIFHLYHPSDQEGFIGSCFLLGYPCWCWRQTISNAQVSNHV